MPREVTAFGSGRSPSLWCALAVGTLGAAGFLLVACRQEQPPTTITSLLGERANLPPPSSDGACRFDLTGDRAVRVFFVLGMLDEYLGRFVIEDDDLVERFYPAEVRVQDLFARELAALADEQHVKAAITRTALPRGHVEFRSAGLTGRINSCYRYRLRREVLIPGSDGRYRRTAQASLDLALFGPGDIVMDGDSQAAISIDRGRASAFVAGAWARYGVSAPTSMFRFGNAHKKARLLVDLLRILGCEDVRLQAIEGRIPNGNIIYFQPTQELARWLRTPPLRGSLVD